LDPRPVFEKHVRQFDADKACKAFKDWHQHCAECNAQISGATSLQKMWEAGFTVRSCTITTLETRHYRRSTLPMANHNGSSWPV